MTRCPEPARLKQLLNDTLPESERSDLSAHLDSCETCQKTLESMVAGKESWSGMARSLKADEPATPVDPALAQAVAELEARAATDETQAEPVRDARVVLAFLSPSNTPGHLGRFGNYEVLEAIGRGGMGVVLKVVDEALQRVVAIKVLAPELATSGQARKRFAREARAAAAVTHEHVVAIHGVDEANGLPYLVMYFVGGVSLQDRLDRTGPLKLEEILRIGMQTASGLAAAHAQGLIHRDIKPANILLENGVERVKITDFGLARAVDDASLTQSGVVAGTPQYMAPEQARGEAVDQRSDLFSLGSVLYALCTGHAPFRASTSMAVLKRVCDDAPRPIREINPEIPEWLEAIVAKLHAKDPAERFQSAAEVADLLSRHLAHLQQPDAVPRPAEVARPGPVATPRRRRFGCGVAVLVVLAILAASPTIVFGPFLFRFANNEATLEIELTGYDNVPIEIRHDGQTVARMGAATWPRLSSIDLPPGAYEVVVVGSPPLDHLAIADVQTRYSVTSSEVHYFKHLLAASKTEYYGEKNQWSVDLERGQKVTIKGHTASLQVSPQGQGSPSAAKDDATLLQGTWVPISFKSDGREEPADGPRAPRVVVFTGSELLFTWNELIPDLPAKANYKLDAGQNPKAMDLVLFAKNQSMDAVAIYKIEGDRLTLCIGRMGERVRPTEFATTAGDGRNLAVFRRGMPDKPSTPKDDLALLQGSWLPVSFEHEGKPTAINDPLAPRVIVFAGSEVLFTWETLDAHFPAKATLSLDSTLHPKAMDLGLIAGNLKVNNAAIYKLEGDRLTVCFANWGTQPNFGKLERPTEFATKPGDGCTLAVFRRGSPQSPDHINIQGRWKLGSVEREGRPWNVAVPDALIFGAAEITRVYRDKPPDGATLRFNYKLDPNANPKTVDLTAVDGDQKGTALGIYQLEGDRLTLCVGMPGRADRPTSFTTKPGDGFDRVVLQREQTPAAAQRTDDLPAIAGVWESKWGEFTLHHPPSKNGLPVAVTGLWQKDGKVLGYVGYHDPALFDPVKRTLELAWYESQTRMKSKDTLSLATDGKTILPVKSTWDWTMTLKKSSPAEAEKIVPVSSIAGEWESRWGVFTIEHKPVEADRPVTIGGFWTTGGERAGTIRTGTFDPGKRTVEFTWQQGLTDGTAKLKLLPDGQTLLDDGSPTWDWTMTRKKK